MAMKQGMNVPAILTVGVAGVLVIGCAMILMEGWFFSLEDKTIQEKYANAPILPLDDIRAKQDKHIDRYAWVDKEKNIVAIPIEDAMKELVRTGGQMPTTQPTR